MDAPLLTTSAYLDAIARESAALAAAARTAGLDAAVPSCPDWNVADLVEHIGNVQRWATATVSTLPSDRIRFSSTAEHPSPDELLDWLARVSRGLVDELTAADPSAPVWTFGPDRTVRFWFRRQAQEAAVHRWDAELAAGDPSPIDAVLAADGVAEWLDLRIAANAAAFAGQGETVHLHCTDTAEDGGGEWLVTLGETGPTVEPVHAKGDVAARGTASDLDLFVWGRVEPDALEVFGDAELLERFRSAGSA
ncbi:MAG: maleylpyruvate isomerase family mycothiol-dependent enzyme [Acidimicrobiia bacterium]